MRQILVDSVPFIFDSCRESSSKINNRRTVYLRFVSPLVTFFHVGCALMKPFLCSSLTATLIRWKRTRETLNSEKMGFIILKLATWRCSNGVSKDSYCLWANRLSIHLMIQTSDKHVKVKYSEFNKFMFEMLCWILCHTKHGWKTFFNYLFQICFCLVNCLKRLINFFIWVLRRKRYLSNN